MRMLLLLAVLAIASSVRMESCPAAEDIHPCNCFIIFGDNIQVSCSGESLYGKGTLKKALSSLSGKRNVRLELKSFALGRVPSDLFSGIGIRTLAIYHCGLDTLSDGGPALTGLENTLEELFITSSFKEDNVPAKLQIRHLKRLKMLSLDSNTVTDLGDDWFQGGPSSLESLSISNNSVKKIGRRAFADLVNMKFLWLNGNRFGTIQRSMFPSPAYQLNQLSLEDNALTELPVGIFSAMPALRTVTVDRNEISYLREPVWSPVWQQLHRLNLEGNPVHCDDHMSWLFQRYGPLYGIEGYCHSPMELAGKSLRDFIGSRRQ